MARYYVGTKGGAYRIVDRERDSMLADAFALLADAVECCDLMNAAEAGIQAMRAQEETVRDAFDAP